MKRRSAVLCVSAMLLSSGAVSAQLSDAMGASGAMGIRDSAMASDVMASGAMGVKQHPRKHAKKHGMNAEPAVSGVKGNSAK